MLTKTIAILGDQEGYSTELLKVLSELKLQLLFVSSDQEKKDGLIRQFEQFETVAELEFISCEKEGCWEADTIILYNPAKLPTALIRSISEVATQKTVLVVSEVDTQKNNLDFKELLPHSMVVDLALEKLKDGTLNSYLEIGEPMCFDI